MNRRSTIFCCLAWLALPFMAFAWPPLLVKPAPMTMADTISQADWDYYQKTGKVPPGKILINGAKYDFCFVDDPKAKPIAVYFSPAGGCTEAVVAEIDAAKKDILVQAYSFTSQPIANAIVRAKKRGVDVQVLADRSDVGGKGTVLSVLSDARIGVFIDSSHPIAHAKIILLDGTVTITGSFNWSAQAEHNSENLLVIRDAELAKKYRANWQAHREHCQPYSRPRVGR